MNIIRICFASALACFTGIAQGDGIYKWVDEQGVTHYSSGTPKDTKSQRVKVQPPGTTTESSGNQPSVREWESRESMKNFRQRQQQQEEAENKVQQEKAKRCEIARQRLSILLDGGSVYSTNENGEREYWDDKTRDEEIRKAKELAANNC